MAIHAVISISRIAALHILTTACESGSRYWLDEYAPVIKRDDEQYVTEIVLSRQTGEGEATESAVRTRIKPHHLGEAIATMVARPGAAYIASDVFSNLDESGCGADADSCDYLLQLMVFGDVVYG